MATVACPCECGGVALQSELAWSTCEHCSEKRQIFARHSHNPHKTKDAIKRSIAHMKNHRQRAHSDHKKRRKTAEGGEDHDSDHDTTASAAPLPAAANTTDAPTNPLPAPLLRLPLPPVRSEPVQSEPVGSEPVQSTPVQSDPVRSEPAAAASSSAPSLPTAAAAAVSQFVPPPPAANGSAGAGGGGGAAGKPLDAPGRSMTADQKHCVDAITATFATLLPLSTMTAVLPDQYDPDSPLALFIPAYTPPSAITAEYFTAEARIAALKQCGPNTLHQTLKRSPKAAAAAAAAAAGAASHQVTTVFANGSVTGRNAALDRLRLPATAKPATTFGSVAGIVKESAAKALFVSNLDAQSVAGNHNDLFPDLFTSLRDEATEVQALVQRAVDAAFQEYLDRRASDEAVPLRRWRRPLEISWDKICAEQLYPLGGFGLTGLQVYIKRVLALTLFHTELCYSSAMNLMRHHSMGAALWVGFFFQDLLKHYSADEARKMMRCEESSFIAVVRKWQADGVRLWYCIQTPGSAVYSPSSVRGAGHVVFTLGPNIVQTAWNAGVSLTAFRECLSHHRECKRSTDNGGDATRFTVPCLRLQALGLQLGLEEELAEVIGLIDDVDANETHPLSRYDSLSTRAAENNRGCQTKCTDCGLLIDLVAIAGRCIDCYQKWRLGPASGPNTSAAKDRPVPGAVAANDAAARKDSTSKSHAKRKRT